MGQKELTHFKIKRESDRDVYSLQRETIYLFQKQRWFQFLTRGCKATIANKYGPDRAKVVQFTLLLVQFSYAVLVL